MPQSLPALTGIRALAALAVVLYHFTEARGNWLGFERLFANGYLSVDLFFILSGFIIHHVYRSTFSERVSGPDYWAFLQFRFARIWPVHVFTMTAMIILFLVAVFIFRRVPADQDAFSAAAIAANLLMVHAWLGYSSPNIPAWSISSEWFAYILFPLVCIGFVRLPTWLKAALGIAAIVAVHLVANLHPLLRIAPEFLLGMVVRELVAFRLPNWRWGGFAVLAAVIASIYGIEGEALALKAALFAALIVVLTIPTDSVGRLLATGPFVYLGEISYSTYMTHGVIWAAVKNVVRLVPGADYHSALVIFPSILLVLAVSALTYHLVELPARRVLRNVFKEARRRASPL